MFTRTQTLSTLGAVAASSAGASVLSSTNIPLGNAIGLHLALYVSTNGSTVTINPTVSVYDDSASQYYSLIASTITSSGHTVLKLGLGQESTTNIQNDYLPQSVKLGITHTTTSPVTYSVHLKKFYPENEY